MIQLIALKIGSSIKLLAENDIILCKSENSITDIILLGNVKFSTYKSLNELQDILSKHDFVRVHAKYIININHILNYISHKNNQLHLSEDNVVQISRRKKRDLMSKFLKL